MLQTAISLKIKPHALKKQRVFDVVALPPKGFAQIIIGIYESIIPPPALQAHITPRNTDNSVDILPARIDENGVLRLKGHFETAPKQVKYQLGFIPSDGLWKLSGITIDIE